MSIFDELQNDLIGDEDLSTALRKAKVLAYRLGNPEFKQWVEDELNGYDHDDPLPEYRKLTTVALGDFFNGAWMASVDGVGTLAKVATAIAGAIAAISAIL